MLCMYFIFILTMHNYNYVPHDWLGMFFFFHMTDFGTFYCIVNKIVAGYVYCVSDTGIKIDGCLV